MAVRIRMMRIGRRHRPFFRINAVDSRNPRNGSVLERLGHYDPLEKDQSKQIVMNVDKARSWLEKGAIPSEAVIPILQGLGLSCPYIKERAARRAKALSIARKKGRPFTKGEKLALSGGEAKADGAEPAAQ